LEVTNNTNNYYYHNSVDYTIGNAQVNSGKWYFEVKVTQGGQIQLGWCTTTYHPQRGGGNYWGYDSSRQQKVSNTGGDSERYGDYCQGNDVFGCALDMEAKTIQFWKNGKDMGVAFTNVAPEAGGRLVPFVALARRVTLQVNFGKDKFAYPQEGYNMLHCFLSEKEIAKLSQLFNRYKGNCFVLTCNVRRAQ